MVKSNYNALVKHTHKPVAKDNKRMTKGKREVYNNRRTAVLYQNGKQTVCSQEVKMTVSDEGLKVEKIQSHTERIPTTTGKAKQTIIRITTHEQTWEDLGNAIVSDAPLQLTW